MNSVKTLLMAALLLTPLLASGTIIVDGKMPPGGIRRCYPGDASTYNPQCESESWQTATGERYNPGNWTAALQLDIAKKERCGYGSGRICYAAVEEPKGRTLIVKINDNGPLHSGSYGNLNRVIDLNEKSMRYMSYEKSGNCSGVVKNVKVCLLDGDQSAYLGPVNEADREAWAKKVLEAPSGSIETTYRSPTSGNPYFSLLGNNGTQGLYPPQPQLPPQPALPPQPGSSQVGQYFGGTPLYNPLPTTSSSATNSPTTGQPLTVAEQLLNLLKPQPKTAETIKGTPIAVGTKLADTATLGSGSATKVETVPIPAEHGGGYQVAPQTFAQTVIMENPPYRPPTPQIQQNPLSVASILEAMKNTLQKILDMLRFL